MTEEYVKCSRCGKIKSSKEVVRIKTEKRFLNLLTGKRDNNIETTCKNCIKNMNGEEE